MAVYLVPGVFGAGGQILDSNGKVASGALVNVYAAGTTSTVNTFTDSLGTVTAANPIVANADGRLPYELWQTGGTAIKIVLTDALANTLGTYDNLIGINDPTTLLTTTNSWTAQQNFNVVAISTLNVSVLSVSTLNVTNRMSVLSVSTMIVSTLSVAKVTAGLVPFARTMIANVTAQGVSTLTVVTATQTVLVANGLGTVTIGDIIFATARVTGTKGTVTGSVLVSITGNGGAVPLFQDGKSGSSDEWLVPAAETYQLNLCAIGTVSVAGTLNLRIDMSSFGSNFVINTGDPGIYVIALTTN